MSKSPAVIPLVNFPGYFAGEDGRIYSTRGRWSNDIKPLAGGPNGSGYFNVILMRDGVRFTRMIHTLICEAFHGLRPSGPYEVSHKDGNKKNNIPSNLLWETKVENRARRLVHDGGDYGTRNSRALINEDQLISIRHLLVEGNLTHKAIGEQFGVSRAFISKIKGGFRYPQKEISL